MEVVGTCLTHNNGTRTITRAQNGADAAAMRCKSCQLAAGCSGGKDGLVSLERLRWSGWRPCRWS